MALTVNPRCIQIREPNLLVPGKKPIGSVKVDVGHQLCPDWCWMFGRAGEEKALIGDRDLTYSAENPKIYSGGPSGLFVTPGYDGDWDRSSWTFSQIWIGAGPTPIVTRPGFTMLIHGRGPWSWINTDKLFGGVIQFKNPLTWMAGESGINPLAETSDHVYVISHNHTTDYVDFYRNGVLDSSVDAVSPWDEGLDRIGGHPSGYGFGGVIGKIGIIAFYGRPLSAGEARTLCIDPYQFLIQA